jgi:hypothetical protein
MYFIYMYENKTMKLVQIVPEKGTGRMRENDGGNESK